MSAAEPIVDLNLCNFQSLVALAGVPAEATENQADQSVVSRERQVVDPRESQEGQLVDPRESQAQGSQHK